MMELSKMPTPSPITEYKITKEQAMKNSRLARQQLFLKERGETYHEIMKASLKGSYYTRYIYSENVYMDDIEKLKQELKEQGFKVIEVKRGLQVELQISWYPEE